MVGNRDEEFTVDFVEIAPQEELLHRVFDVRCRCVKPEAVLIVEEGVGVLT